MPGSLSLQPYLSPLRGESPAQQARRIMETLIIAKLNEHPDNKIGLLYAANNIQAEALHGAMRNNNADVIPTVFQGGGQAEVFAALCILINQQGLAHRIHILPIATSLTGGFDQEGFLFFVQSNQVKKEHIDRDLSAIRRHVQDGVTVYGIPRYGKKNEYAIGGGNSTNWLTLTNCKGLDGKTRDEYVQEQLQQIALSAQPTIHSAPETPYESQDSSDDCSWSCSATVSESETPVPKRSNHDPNDDHYQHLPNHESDHLQDDSSLPIAERNQFSVHLNKLKVPEDNQSLKAVNCDIKNAILKFNNAVVALETNLNEEFKNYQNDTDNSCVKSVYVPTVHQEEKEIPTIQSNIADIAYAQRMMVNQIVAAVKNAEQLDKRAQIAAIRSAANLFKNVYNAKLKHGSDRAKSMLAGACGAVAAAAIGVGLAFLAFFALSFTPIEAVLFSSKFFLTVGSTAGGLGFFGGAAIGRGVNQHFFAHGDNLRGAASKVKDTAIKVAEEVFKANSHKGR